MSLPERFTVGVQRVGDVVVIKPAGELDMATVEDVRSAMAAAADARRTVLDLSRISFIDTSGVRLIIGEREAASQADREFRIVSGPPEVQRIFELVGLTSRMPFEDTAEAAVGAET